MDTGQGIERVKLWWIMARHDLACVGSLFQKRESHTITNIAGHHKTEMDLVMIRKQQLWGSMTDCSNRWRTHHNPA